MKGITVFSILAVRDGARCDRTQRRGWSPMVETTMEQKEQLQHLSADELWSMREDVDLKLATILLKRKSMLEERLERLQPRQVQSRGVSRVR